MSCTCERVFAFDLFGVDGEELRDWSPVEPTDVIVYSYPLPCGLLYHVSGIAKTWKCPAGVHPPCDDGVSQPLSTLKRRET